MIIKNITAVSKKRSAEYTRLMELNAKSREYRASVKTGTKKVPLKIKRVIKK